jgi:hypothetical protein
MLDTLSSLFTTVHAWLFEALVQPVLYQLGFMAYAEQAFNALEVTLYGVLEIGLMLLLLRPLEWWRPVERWPDRRAVRVDVFYTFLTASASALAVFLLLSAGETIDGTLRLNGAIPQSRELMPWLTAHPLVSFFAYLAILDFSEFRTGCNTASTGGGRCMPCTTVSASFRSGPTGAIICWMTCSPTCGGCAWHCSSECHRRISSAS